MYQLKTLKRRAALHGIAPRHDLNQELPPGQIMRGMSTLYTDKGKALQWIKTRTADDALQRYLEDFTERLAERVEGRFAKTVMPALAANDDLLSAYVVGDAHIGMYAWGAETNDDNFDTDIAVAELRGAFRHLIHAAPVSDIGMLVNVGDFLHANDTTSQTPASKNLLDTDGRFGQVIDRAVAVLCDGVSLMLDKHREVWVVLAPGNHDPDAAVWLNIVLTAYFRNEPRVKIISNAAKLIHVEFGKNLIATHHGDRIKPEQLYQAVTRDLGEVWGRTLFRYMLTGHIHHKRMIELGGMIFESFNTLAPRDKWHADGGYGAQRDMHQITFHKQHGQVGRNICGLQMARLAA